MRSFMSRSISPLRCRKSAQDHIDDINKKEKAMLKTLARRPNGDAVEIEKIGKDQIAIHDPPPVRAVRGRSLSQMQRSKSLIRPDTDRKSDLNDGIDRTRSCLSWNGDENENHQGNRLNHANDKEAAPLALSRSRSITRLFRSRSRSPVSKEREPSLEPIDRTRSWMSRSSAVDFPLTHESNGERKNIESDQSAPRRRNSIKQLFRSRTRDTGSGTEQGSASGEFAIKLKQEDLKDIHSALREMEKQVALAQKQGSQVSKASVLDALRSVVNSLDSSPMRNFRIKVESTADHESDSETTIGEATTGDESRYTYASYVSNGHSQFLADYTVDSNDVSGTSEDNETTSQYTEFTEADTTRDGREADYESTSGEDDSEFEHRSYGDDTADYASYGDDLTTSESIATSYTSAEGFKIGQTNFTIKTPSLANVFQSWNTNAGVSLGKPEKEKVETPSSLLQQVSRASIFSQKADTPPNTRVEPSLENPKTSAKKPNGAEQKNAAPATLIGTSPSFASMGSSDIFSTDTFRSLSSFNSSPPPQKPEGKLPPDANNIFDLTSWLKLDETDLRKVWDDLLWPAAPKEKESRAVTPPPIRNTYVCSRELFQESIEHIVPTKRKTNSWLEATPTEASSSPSDGDSPERASIEVSRNRTIRQPKAWFRRIKAPDSKQAKVVVCNHASDSSPLDSPIASKSTTSASAYLSAVTQRYIFDDDEVDA